MQKKHLTIKTPHRLGLEGNVLSLINCNHQKLEKKLILNGKHWKLFLLSQE